MFNPEKININGKIALSPMAGVSDSPTRQLTRKMGSAFSFTEFVSTDGIKKAFKRLSTYLSLKKLKDQFISKFLETGKKL